jgi:ribonucleoside-diphosphate reductase alpha chain
MLELSFNSLEVLKSRYLLRDSHQNIIETPETLFRRVAKESAKAEMMNDGKDDAAYWEEQFYELMTGLYFLPNSPALMNSGTAVNQLSACFVLPIEKEIDNIFDTLKKAMIIQKSNGGTGFNFSELYSELNQISKEKDYVLRPLEVIELFDTVIEKLKVHSKRAGANMGILNIDHPDIQQFIRSKRNENRLQNFNLSVGIKDQFMEAVETGSDWIQKDPVNEKYQRGISASLIWEEIIQSAWQSGDPGLIFLDEIERKNPTPAIGILNCTNPCGEVPLLPNEACNLGSINLIKFVQQKNEGEYEIQWEELNRVIKKSIRMLDNIITVNNYILPEIKNIVHNNRKIGLGVMGWAEMLILLEIPYQSEKAIALAHTLMEFINRKAHEASARLAEERGCFPNWNKSIYYKNQPMRNATCTSIAPTGSIAIIAGTSPSIEPLFALAFTRENVLGNKTLIEFNSILLNKLVAKKLDSTDLLDEIKETGILPTHKRIPAYLNELFLTATQIEAKTHIRHQSAFQKYTDNAVSKTINMKKSATKEDIGNAFKYAWKQKLKGITIFRNESKQKQIIRSGIENSNSCAGSACID